jgi:hypothetical protein
MKNGTLLALASAMFLYAPTLPVREGYRMVRHSSRNDVSRSSARDNYYRFNRQHYQES